jgi:hypothetical protein
MMASRVIRTALLTKGLTPFTEGQLATKQCISSLHGNYSMIYWGDIEQKLTV